MYYDEYYNEQAWLDLQEERERNRTKPPEPTTDWEAFCKRLNQECPAQPSVGMEIEFDEIVFVTE